MSHESIYTIIDFTARYSPSYTESLPLQHPNISLLQKILIGKAAQQNLLLSPQNHSMFCFVVFRIWQKKTNFVVVIDVSRGRTVNIEAIRNEGVNFLLN